MLGEGRRREKESCALAARKVREKPSVCALLNPIALTDELSRALVSSIRPFDASNEIPRVLLSSFLPILRRCMSPVVYIYTETEIYGEITPLLFLLRVISKGNPFLRYSYKEGDKKTRVKMYVQISQHRSRSKEGSKFREESYKKKKKNLFWMSMSEIVALIRQGRSYSTNSYDMPRCLCTCRG